MADDQESWADRLARGTRVALVAAVAVVAALLISNPPSASLNPFSVGRANAQGGVSSAPGYLALSTTAVQGDRFYIIDTNKQVICVYNITGAQLRLVAARKFDCDAKIWDSSLNLGPNLPPFDGNSNGIPRNPPPGQPDKACAKNYAEQFQKWEEKDKAK